MLIRLHIGMRSFIILTYVVLIKQKDSIIDYGLFLNASVATIGDVFFCFVYNESTIVKHIKAKQDISKYLVTIFDIHIST